MSNSPHFEPVLSRVFDHLYANAKHRTPGAIELEIRKLIQVAIYLERVVNPLQPAFSVSLDERKQLKQSPKATAQFAKMIRDAYSASSHTTDPTTPSKDITLSDFDLVYCCIEFSGITFADNKRDLFGDSVELFRSHWSKSQGGQFFTDQRVTSLAIDLLDFRGNSNQTMVDLCAGTGGFIIAALKRLQTLPQKKNLQYSSAMLDKVIGFEADESVTSVGNEAISALTGINCTRINTANSLLLTSVETVSPTSSLFGKVSHAATNPPFGAKILVKDPAILAKYDLARQRRQHDLKPLPLDVLFIEQNYNLLREGGKLAIVLPFQTLSGPQSTWIRRWLLDRFQIIAVIDLPSETFQPYTGTKTSLVVAEKRAGGVNSQTTSIFMACPQHIGHDRRGNPVWQKDVSGRELDQVLTDIPVVSRVFEQWKTNGEITEGKEICFSVSVESILKNSDLRIDARFYQPSEAETKTQQLRIKSGFHVQKLGDLCDRIFFPGRFRRSYTSDIHNSVPFMGGTNISQLLLATEKRIDVRDANYDKLKVEAGWILITRSGSTGIISCVANDWGGYAISEHVIRIVPNKDKIDPEYLYSFLQTQLAQDYIRRGVFGSVIDELSPDYLAEMEVFVPKDPAKTANLTQMVAKGLHARNEAIEHLTSANELLNKMFGATSIANRSK